MKTKRAGNRMGIVLSAFRHVNWIKTMKKELEDKLFKKHNKILDSVHYLEVSDGWYKLIDRLCEAIQAIVDSESLEQVKAVQVKEKFGGLRFYTAEYVESPEIQKLIEEAESASYVTCETCGSPASCEAPNGWYKTSCEAHK